MKVTKNIFLLREHERACLVTYNLQVRELKCRNKMAKEKSFPSAKLKEIDGMLHQ